MGKTAGLILAGLVASLVALAACGAEPELTPAERAHRHGWAYLDTHQLDPSWFGHEGTGGTGGYDTGGGPTGGDSGGNSFGSLFDGSLGGEGAGAAITGGLASGPSSVPPGGLASGPTSAGGFGLPSAPTSGAGGVAPSGTVGFGGTASGPGSVSGTGFSGAGSLAGAFCGFFDALCDLFARCMPGDADLGIALVCGMFGEHCVELIEEALASADAPPLPPQIVPALNCVSSRMRSLSCSGESEALLGEFAALGTACGLESFSD